MEALAPKPALFSFEIQDNMLLASWHESVGSESEEFFRSVEYMFELGFEKNIKNVLIDSGVPVGGTLTLEVISMAQKNIQNLALEKIALLESPDFYWDNNLFQFIQYLRSGLQLSFEVQMFSQKTDAIEWLQKPA